MHTTGTADGYDLHKENHRPKVLIAHYLWMRFEYVTKNVVKTSFYVRPIVMSRSTLYHKYRAVALEEGL